MADGSGLSGAASSRSEVFTEKGIFGVPHSIPEERLPAIIEQRVRKFGAVLEAKGWTILSAATVTKIKMYEDEGYTSRKGLSPRASATTVALWVPKNKGMRPDHPLYRPEETLYEVAFRVERRPRLVRFELPDEFIETHGDLLKKVGVEVD